MRRGSCEASASAQPQSFRCSAFRPQEPIERIVLAARRASSPQRGIQPYSVSVEAFRRLEVGGVIINDYPTFRVDQMPYGGVKGSGTGREGPRFAIEEMTELKLCSFRL